MNTKKIKYLILLSTLYVSLYNAQTTNDYISIYNNIAPKLNSLVINKAQFYNQNFSNFYNELQNKNLIIKTIGIHGKTDTSPKNYVLHLNFLDDNFWNIAVENKFQYPSIWITFENEIPSQAINLMKQSYGDWNNNLAQFFSGMKIINIKFSNINGYNNPDRSPK